MPYLGQQNLKKLYLPSTEHLPEADRAWVELNTNITAEDILGVGDYDKQLDKNAFAISKMVTQWNLTTAPGSDDIAPITLENVRKLPLVDFNFLGAYQGERQAQQVQGAPTSLKEN